MNRKVRKARQALHAARRTYKKAAEDFLAAVEGTPAEIEAADKIIYDDYISNIVYFHYDLMSRDEDVADVILDCLRGEIQHRCVGRAE
jgi:hypothetical protein